MPVVHPAELWQESGRWYKVDAEMGRFQDRTGRDMVLGMTHEEVAADLARREIHSYRQLPLVVYQIQTKWRDDPRPRGGLVRVREFTMKDSYTFDATWESLEQQYRAHYQAYFNIFHRCGLPVIAFATGALPEMITNGAGRVVPYGSNFWNLEPPVIAPLVEAAHEVTADLPAFRLAARHRAEQAYNIDRIVAAYLEVLLGK